MKAYVLQADEALRPRRAHAFSSAKYREENITLESLMAFTVIDDHRRQLKVFKSLQDWQKDEPSEIRAALTEKMIEASSKLALFVGVDAYVAAGGPTRADLFGEEVYLEKPCRPAQAGQTETRKHPKGSRSRRLGMD